jgi:hypothetical protein
MALECILDLRVRFPLGPLKRGRRIAGDSPGFHGFESRPLQRGSVKLEASGIKGVRVPPTPKGGIV